jgi:hypothetical protein
VRKKTLAAEAAQAAKATGGSRNNKGKIKAKEAPPPVDEDQPAIVDCPTRGGAFTELWMKNHGHENGMHHSFC